MHSTTSPLDATDAHTGPVDTSSSGKATAKNTFIHLFINLVLLLLSVIQENGPWKLSDKKKWALNYKGS